jgi:NADH-quinone oxidoreductase subunit H
VEETHWLTDLGFLVLNLAVALVALLLAAAYLVLAERKLLGRFQIRLGPNRVGFHGIWQPVADGIKLLLKEDLVPAGSDRTLFLYVPILAAIVPLLIFAVIPLGPATEAAGRGISPVLSDLNVGLLYVLALSSLSVYGVTLGGWASNSKFSLLGGIRSAAQMISYELAMGLALVPIVMLAGSFSLQDIVAAQSRLPFLLLQPFSFVIFLVSALAESKRLPFDLPEAESELMAGYHTEYSGMRFAFYFLGEYVNMIILGALVAVFFLGGWRGPLLPPVLWLIIKIIPIPFFLIWTRASLPRLRYDQLMQLGWKVMIPAALVNIVLTGAVILWLE